jgi:hypothetical protein
MSSVAPTAGSCAPTPLRQARDFAQRLEKLLERERHAAADFLVALAEFDTAKLWRELGYASLFHFLHRALRLSRGAAHYRKVAAELIQHYPEVVPPLRDGRLCITTVFELSKALTPENRGEVLPRFFYLSRREAEQEAAAINPVASPPLREVVTAVRAPSAASAARAPAALAPVGPAMPAPSRGTSDAPGTSVPVSEASATDTTPPEAPAPDAATRTLPASAAGRAGSVSPLAPPAVVEPPTAPLALTVARLPTAPQPPPTRPDTIEALDAKLSRMHVTVTRDFLRKLDAARDALSHAKPGASMAEVLEAGLDLVLERHDKRRGLVEKPRAAHPRQDPAHVPAAVKRVAWKRARGCCEWPLDAGGACGSKLRLEFDHIQPLAVGGTSTAENVRVLCALHNAVAARRVFGDAWMNRFTRRGAGPGPPPGPPTTPRAHPRVNVSDVPSSCASGETDERTA